MSVSELLVERAEEYELRAVSCEERAGLAGEEGEQGHAALGFAAVALALREIADVFDAERGEEGAAWS